MNINGPRTRPWGTPLHCRISALPGRFTSRKPHDITAGAVRLSDHRYYLVPGSKTSSVVSLPAAVARQVTGVLSGEHYLSGPHLHINISCIITSLVCRAPTFSFLRCRAPSSPLHYAQHEVISLVVLLSYRVFHTCISQTVELGHQVI